MTVRVELTRTPIRGYITLTIDAHSPLDGCVFRILVDVTLSFLQSTPINRALIPPLFPVL